MVFKIILIKLRHHSINNNYLHLPIQSAIIHRQTVFQQLLQLLFHLFLFILKKIIFLYLICNIYIYIFFKQKKTNNYVRSLFIFWSSFLYESFEKKTQSSDIFLDLHVLFFFIYLYFSFFFFFFVQKNSDSHLHLHYLTVCNRTI